MTQLTYNSVSGHVKRNGAVVATIMHDKRKKLPYSFVHYNFSFDAGRIKDAATIEEMLPQIKELLK